MTAQFDIVILGLTITSSWGNGHATTYRSLVRGLSARGHRILFLERDMHWYAGNRDEPHPAGAVTELYRDFEDLVARFEAPVRDASLVMVGSFVREGANVGDWVTSVARGRTAFYDIDTPVTLAQLEAGDREYITPALIPRYHAYFSFTGGPTLRYLESHYGAPVARVLYCSVDTGIYHPQSEPMRWDLGYLGTYSPDRQPSLDLLLLEPARKWPQGRFALVGAMYPEDIRWPGNVHAQIHLSPREHSAFYGAQRFTLNVTRAEMKKRGYSPSVRLFEAGACGVPIISDAWEGLEELFVPGREILISVSAEDTLRYLHDISKEQRAAIGEAARLRVLAQHTPAHRAAQLERYWKEINDNALPDTPRRNGRRREIDPGLAAGMSSEPSRTTSGEVPGGEAVAMFHPRHLYQPTGTGRRDRPTAREPARSEGPSVHGSGRDAVRNLGGPGNSKPGST